MAEKTEGKETIEKIRAKSHDINVTLSRPRNFSLRRRTEVYYFSDNSARGILKRIPVKNGTYKMNEPQTVFERSDATKSRKDIWSDVLLNSFETSQANNQNTSEFQSSIHDQKMDPFLKSLDKNAQYKPRSYSWNDLSDLEGRKNNTKTKGNDDDSMKFNNLDKNTKMFSKPFQGIKKKEQSRNALEETDAPKFKRSVSTVKYKKLSSINVERSSSKKLADNNNTNYKRLNETWTIESLSDVLSQMKTPSTEL